MDNIQGIVFYSIEDLFE